MEWKDLFFSIGGKGILKSVTGSIAPGRVTCVLGPSGSGKSTLMNVLAGRQKTNSAAMRFSGTISASGRTIDPFEFRHNIAYVMQDDHMLATETPRECLRLSAYLRLPKEVTREEHHKFVEQLLDTLGLNKCADVMIGSALRKGISGGERKRTSVGVELITNPQVLFLDEPLSGLDSYAAYTLVLAMKRLAGANVPVLCTVHQPSSEIFEMFDDVVMLHDGEVVFHGPVDVLSGYFGDLGFPCRQNFNPADHVMFLMQKEPPESVRMVKDSWLTSNLHLALVEHCEQLHDDVVKLTGKTRNQDSDCGHFGCCRELVQLTKREARGTLRNKGSLIARYGMSVFLSGLYGWLFFGVGRRGESSCLPPPHFVAGACASEFQAHFGAIISLCIASMMGCAQPVLLTFPNERPVFLREYAAQMYGVIPYFVSKTFIEIPVVLVSQIVTFLIVYWLMGLHGDFLVLVLYASLLGIASSSLSLIVGCGVADAQKATQLAPLALIPQFLFSGLLLPVGNIPVSLRWMGYLCPLKYAVNLMELEEFRYVRKAIDACVALHGVSTCENPNESPVPGDLLQIHLLRAQEVNWSEEGFYLAMLIVLFFAFRASAMILLWRKGRFVF
jgi:ABC-type multidrug transport system ATPase subunit